jgi:hypothetical protein
MGLETASLVVPTSHRIKTTQRNAPLFPLLPEGHPVPMAASAAMARPAPIARPLAIRAPARRPVTALFALKPII